MSNYPTNLTEKQWQVIKNIVEPQERNRKSSLREIVNGIFYYFRKWKLEGVWKELLNVLHAKARKSVGKEESDYNFHSLQEKNGYIRKNPFYTMIIERNLYLSKLTNHSHNGNLLHSCYRWINL